ncbi:mannose-1-phosphate guanylyltransferase/mannose-6-phosphate isomerase [Shewanella algae]|uniref:mannose-1-phosphate guanylyltransferase/mannose-6-phosphate isomerase n=1 Tax=Shewanella algae TaxID=38313 RepID=UPI001AAD8125|nr:mannose-1-phosphate guanylyltransferase/mannose-6-phosphate isomerase [Shewanella algae]MBO2564633.1 mannose-1-phosphate guanylyltransferase/mannose-6-phosphate isomerase [Shewanella algae]MBO2611453.1 mannose-1-phosphate guanylyltransferase/mannose-6-phosphate isomerase [Shewanella algae]UZD60632.1 mannose-1-phosphate guanylyltransferase/mannose-6-phosphate isomerase [Shewanella algae]
MILPVVMAGGSGTRLWPLSRGNFPKQFLSLFAEKSMLQETLARLDGLSLHPPLVVCNEEHRFLAAEQLRLLGNIGNARLILEPVGRNTAPAIALAALKAIENKDDPILLVLAADHVIGNVDLFKEAVHQAKIIAEEGEMVTFGIVPTHAETGYGYIKRGAEKSRSCFQVDRFVEKPNLLDAQEYLEGGEYYWNSGMFMFKASRYLEELENFRPDIYEACVEAIKDQKSDLDFIRVTKEAFEACPEESIDYAVMEKTERAVVVPLDAGWNDVGGFAALWEVSGKDERGNAFKGDIVSVNSSNCLVCSDEKLIATVGVNDLVIINTKDAVLVAHKDKAQEVKHVVNKLKADGRSEVTFHREVYRPWGKYDSVDNGERFQVKRITVKPGAKLSVQMHHHRAEHWIVVSGTAKVTINGKEQFVTENQSVYIPITAVHALENPGKVELELIEVQSGSYLGEDDIVRFEDRYGRV